MTSISTSTKAPGSPRIGWSPAVDLVKGMTQEPADLISLACDVASSQQTDGSWNDLDSSVVHHVALATYLRRAAHAKEFGRAMEPGQRQALTPDADTLQRLESSLAKSWAHLTGNVSADYHAMPQPLKGKVVRQLSLPVAQLHEALLGSSLKTRIEPQQVLTQALASVDAAVDGAPLPAQPKRGVSAASVLAIAGVAGAVGVLAAAPGLALLVAGAAVGWAVSSANESIVHEKILHLSETQPGTSAAKNPQTAFAKVFAKSPDWLKNSVQGIWFGHTKIHHFQTFKQDQITQFKSPEEKAKLDAYLHKQGREDMIDEEYGATIGLKGHLMYQAISMPSYVVALGAALALGAGPLFAVGFALPALGFQGVVKEYHRYTHMPAQKALDTASLPMREFLKTSLSRYNMRRHFVHHEEPNTNFNLMPGGDWLRGKSKRASVAQEEELRRLGVLW